MDYSQAFRWFLAQFLKQEGTSRGLGAMLGSRKIQDAGEFHETRERRKKRRREEDKEKKKICPPQRSREGREDRSS